MRVRNGTTTLQPHARNCGLSTRRYGDGPGDAQPSSGAVPNNLLGRLTAMLPQRPSRIKVPGTMQLVPRLPKSWAEPVHCYSETGQPAGRLAVGPTACSNETTTPDVDVYEGKGRRYDVLDVAVRTSHWDSALEVSDWDARRQRRWIVPRFETFRTTGLPGLQIHPASDHRRAAYEYFHQVDRLVSITIATSCCNRGPVTSRGTYTTTPRGRSPAVSDVPLPGVPEAWTADWATASQVTDARKIRTKAASAVVVAGPVEVLRPRPTGSRRRWKLDWDVLAPPTRRL